MIATRDETRGRAAALCILLAWALALSCLPACSRPACPDLADPKRKRLSAATTPYPVDRAPELAETAAAADIAEVYSLARPLH